MRTFSAGARMRNMRRRSFLKVATATPLAAAAQTPSPRSGMKITRVRYYAGSGDAAMRKTKVPGLFNQSTNVVVVQTDAGITGIGEGGSKDTMEQCAAAIIGMDPFRTEQLWQILYRGYFYPAGREKLHAIGALDMALWDIKAKALNVPLYQLLGGLTRDHVECYATAYPDKGSIKGFSVRLRRRGLSSLPLSPRRRCTVRPVRIRQPHIPDVPRSARRRGP